MDGAEAATIAGAVAATTTGTGAAAGAAGTTEVDPATLRVVLDPVLASAAVVERSAAEAEAVEEEAEEAGSLEWHVDFTMLPIRVSRWGLDVLVLLSALSRLQNPCSPGALRFDAMSDLRALHYRTRGSIKCTGQANHCQS